MLNSTYHIRIENADGITRYYTSFTDGEGRKHEAEVSIEVYLALEECRKHEKRQENFVDRHVEQADLSESQLQGRMIRLPPALETLLENQEQTDQLLSAIATLSETQQKRFLLYHEGGFSQEQIAAQDGCSQSAVAYSIYLAKEKIKRHLKLF